MQINLLDITFSIGNICPCEWDYFDGRCYYISATKAATWQAARANCRKRGGDLAVPTNSTNNRHIYEAIKARSIGVVYIGLYRVDKNLGYNKFYDVRGIEARYSNWYSAEPNNLGGREACTEMIYKSQHFYGGREVAGKWNDLSCSGYTRHYVCQVSYVCQVEKYDN